MCVCVCVCVCLKREREVEEIKSEFIFNADVSLLNVY